MRTLTRVSVVDSTGDQSSFAEAHRGDGKRFVVRMKADRWPAGSL
jgi:hypothetical protein